MYQGACKSGSCEHHMCQGACSLVHVSTMCVRVLVVWFM